MKLKIKDLKKFNAVAGGMQQNRLLPILNYLKFHEGYITKSNLKSFVIMESDFKGSVLLDENILYSFIERLSGEFVDVEVKGKSVFLSSGKEKISHSFEDVINFPIVPDEPENSYLLPEEVMGQIKIASNFCVDIDDAPAARYVYVGNGMVCAMNGIIVYINKGSEDCPKIMLDKNSIQGIKNLGQVHFSENEQYNFFSTPSFRLGFIKAEVGFLDFQPFLTMQPKEGGVTMDKGELLNFCETAVKITAGMGVIAAKITGEKISMEDGKYGIAYEKNISKKIDDFMFNPIYMAQQLKSLPDDELTFTKKEGRYYVTGESGFVSIIMEMVYNN